MPLPSDLAMVIPESVAMRSSRPSGENLYCSQPRPVSPMARLTGVGVTSVSPLPSDRATKIWLWPLLAVRVNARWVPSSENWGLESVSGPVMIAVAALDTGSAV